MTVILLAVALVVGLSAGYAAGHRARRPGGRRVSPDVQREVCAAFVASVERWLEPLSGPPPTRPDRRGLAILRDDAHLAFARLELVVPERVRLAGRLWMDDAQLAHDGLVDGTSPSAGTMSAGASAAARPLVDRAWSHRHDFYVLVRDEIGTGGPARPTARVG